MARNYAAVPYEYLEEMEPLTDEEFGRLIRGLLRYSRDGVEIPAEGNLKFYAKRVMKREDYYRKGYDELTEKRRRAGEKGAENRWKDRGLDGNAILPLANDGNNENKYNNENKSKNKKENYSYPPRGNPRRKGAAAAPPGEMEKCLKRDIEWLREWSAQHAGEEIPGNLP